MTLGYTEPHLDVFDTCERLFACDSVKMWVKR
ncbi:unnamed protein product [Fusarium graminearum]|uniref:Chromosome 2, complete genome n=1 Tax=Gibberella zeae (strain ATCC MYA-4620 / CBS 123657 / FGSC 9075 / NRRL 31084 / PH-1) TaxID=229533 RepID=A0A098DIP7_GIBZE|nr:unnamed protein product [Fusarium graminearum]